MLKELLPHNSKIGDWISEFDLVLDMRWGDSFSDIYGLRRLAMMNSLARIAVSNGVTLAMGPQTIGPFESFAGRSLGRFAARRADIILARDSQSSEYCNEFGLPAVIQSTDVVFALPVPLMEKKYDIAINVSGLLWNENPHIDRRVYRNSLVRLCRSLLDSGREITLFAHVLDSDGLDNDVPAVKDLQSELSHQVDAFIPRELSEVRGFVASADLVIGARMHACLNALSVGTPAIPLAYSRKFAPLLEDLGWHHTVDLRGDSCYVGQVRDRVESSPGLKSELDSLRRRADGLLDEGTRALKELVLS
ncbi:polysaccharide pyruvyl transferase family protein [Rhodococcus sp. NPDC057529]|uniref:polysaccharide pyruvyl transferase family protein n=1 Tax=Rhodococcus sp. NPDC057529 TaxID=3346158 RepID=UPI0036707DBC